jgi:hypothetical protein
MRMLGVSKVTIYEAHAGRNTQLVIKDKEISLSR